MAQTHNAPHLVDGEINADQTAWNAAAVARKFRVDGGKVWHYTSGGMLFPIPAPQGFAALSAAVQPLFFQAVAQFIGARIGQNAEGNIADAVVKAMTGGEIPRANDNDAYEAVYTLEIASRMEKAGVTAPDKSAPAADKVAYRDRITATANKYRDQLFAKAVAAAKANIVRAPTDKKRTASKPKVDGVEIDLGE